jgi:hypothetical protein
MALYLVRANPKQNLHNLQKELESVSIAKLERFGETLSYGLSNTKKDVDGNMICSEEDYCSPPLAMVREAVLDRYFTDIKVERIQNEQVGWNKIKLPNPSF